ncbi:MAG: hypothetical protein Q7S22_00525 [Candidatus Micrarchaeota archaeon]|nr:hypothetical protein [Candidatus Micrarchaeota archaeon]
MLKFTPVFTALEELEFTLSIVSLTSLALFLINCKFFSLSCGHPNIIDIDLCMGEWNIELDVEIENSQAFHELMIQLRTEFSKLIKNYDSLLVFAEHTYSYYPLIK